MNEFSQALRIVVVLDNGFQNTPYRDAAHVCDDRTQFQIGAFHYLLQAIEHIGALAHQLRSLPGEVAAVALLDRWNETGFEQSMLQEIGISASAPTFSILHVGLAARHAFDMLGVDQEQFEIALQDIPDGLTEFVGTLHGNVGAVGRGKPIRQLQQLRRTRPEGLDRFDAVTLIIQTEATGDDGELVHIESRTMRIEHVHGLPPRRRVS